MKRFALAAAVCLLAAPAHAVVFSYDFGAFADSNGETAVETTTLAGGYTPSTEAGAISLKTFGYRSKTLTTLSAIDAAPFA